MAGRKVDYTQVVGKTNGKAKGTMPYDMASRNRRFWWTAEKGSEDEAELVASTMSALNIQNMEWELANLRWHRLYAGIQSMAGMVGFTASAANFLQSQSLRTSGMGPSYNVIQACCDTATAKIGGNTSRPLCRTVGGDYKMQRKAKQINKFLRGMFEQNDTYHLSEQCFKDGTVEGTGVLHVYDDEGEIKSERVWLNEMMVDEADAMNGKPRSIMRRRYIARETLIACYPKKKEELEDVPRENFGVRMEQADMVLVTEAWHLPSRRGGKDGRHVICCGKVNLWSEDWKRDHFPFAMIPWVERQLGIWGQGIAERQLQLQIEINETLLTQTKSHRLVSLPQVWVKAGSKIDKSHINNEVGHIGVYQTDPPVFMNAPAVSPEYRQWLMDTFQKAFELEGLSEMSVNSVKPAGLNSEPGLETYHDIESERFKIQERNYERFIKCIAELYIEEAIAIDEADEYDLVVKVPADGYDEEIRWRDINLKRDEYTLFIEQVSEVPDTMAGKLELIQQMAQLGVMTPDEAIGWMDLGDTGPFIRMAMAGYNDVLYRIDKIIEEGVYLKPTPQCNLALCVKWGNAAYLTAFDERSGIPEERLNYLLQFVDDAQFWIDRANTPPPGALPAPGSPLAKGQPVPVNPLARNQAPPPGMPQAA